MLFAFIAFSFARGFARLFVEPFSFKNGDHHGVIPLFALALGGHFHGIEQAGDGSGSYALLGIHLPDRGDDIGLAPVGRSAMSR